MAKQRTAYRVELEATFATKEAAESFQETLMRIAILAGVGSSSIEEVTFNPTTDGEAKWAAVEAAEKNRNW